jgi:hypothetical protein
VSRTRLVFFLSTVEGSLATLRQALVRASERAGLPTPHTRWLESALPLIDSGWQAAELSFPEGGQPTGPSVLEVLTRATVRELRLRVVGLCVEGAAHRLKALLCEPGRSARLQEGERVEVVQQVARWLSVEPGLIARVLEPARPRNQLSAAVELGSAEAATQEPAAEEMDEEDRYVASRLAEARRLMARYRARSK